MNKYHLSFFENHELSALSYSTCRQEQLFLVAVSKDRQEALDIVNFGRSLDGIYGIPRTLPTANSSEWIEASVLTFDRLSEAYRTARFIDACARRPTQLHEIKDGMREANKLRWPAATCPFTYWNRTDHIRYVPDTPVHFVFLMANMWALSNRINVRSSD